MRNLPPGQGPDRGGKEEDLFGEIIALRQRCENAEVVRRTIF